MKRTLYLTVALLAALFVATDAQAQKFPERRLVRKGNRSYERLDYNKAAERYQQAIGVCDSCYEATFNLGDALYKQKEYDEAGKIFSALAADSTRSDLDRAQSYYNLGNTLFQQKRYQEALSAFKKSLRLNPADLETKYNYAYTKKFIEDQQQQGGGGGNDQNQNQNQQNDQNQGGGNDQQNDQQNNQNDQNNDQNQNDQNKDQNGEGENDKDQNNDQNKDQNKDQNDNKGDRNNDQQNDQNQNDQNDDQNGEGEDQQNDGQNDPREGEGGEQPSGLSQNDAERMLDAIQGEEDKTRDKVNAKVGRGVVKSGKNW